MVIAGRRLCLVGHFSLLHGLSAENAEMHVVQTQGETRYVFRHPLVGDEIQNRFELLVRRVGVEDPLQSHWRFRRKLKFESERPLAGSLDDRVLDMSAGGSVKRAV